MMGTICSRPPSRSRPPRHPLPRLDARSNAVPLVLLSLLATRPAAAAPAALLLNEGKPVRAAVSQLPAPQVELRPVADGVAVSLRLDGLLVDRITTPYQGELGLVELPGAGVTTTVSHPLLPVLRRTLPLPSVAAKARVVVRAVRVETYSLAELGLGERLLPVQRPLPKIPGAKPPARLPLDLAFYRTDVFSPQPLATLAPLGSLAGQALALLELRPLQYNPGRGELRIVREAELLVELPGGLQAAFRTDLRRARPEGMLLGRLLPWVPRPSGGGAFKSGEAQAPPSLIVVTSPGLVASPSLARLLSWKTEKGYRVTLVSTDDTGTTSAEIRAYLRQVWSSGAVRPSFVLLVGDTNTIPAFAGRAADRPATDLNYAMLDGEDIVPDVGIGRLPARTEEQLALMVRKTLDYELHAWDSGWEQRACLLTGVDNSRVTEGTQEYVIRHNLTPHGYSADRHYANSRRASAQDMVAALLEGRSLNLYSGHGEEAGWVDGINVNNAIVHGLDNGIMPVTLSFACLTGRYTVVECFGEAWLRSRGGGVGFIGSSVTSGWEQDDVLQKQMFAALLPEGGAGTVTWLAGFLQLGKAGFSAHYGGRGETRRYFEMYNLLGDPSLELWTGQPQALEAQVPPLVFFGMETLDLQAGRPGALVGVTRDGQLVGAAYSGPDGTAQVPLDPEATAVPGDLLVTITAHDHLPARYRVALAPSSSDGMLRLSAERMGPASPITVIVADADLIGRQQLEITAGVEGGAGGSEVAVALTEEDRLGVYFGQLDVTCTPGGVLPPDTVRALHGQQVEVRYRDADTGAGSPADKLASVTVDCQPPAFAGLATAEGGQSRVMLSWAPAEDDPGSSPRYDIFRSERPGGQDLTQPLASTTLTHFVDIQVVNGRWYYYVVRAVDELGNSDDNLVERSAQPREPRPSLVFSLDADPGWQVQGRWAFGPPQGRGGQHGSADPASAFTGTNVYGYNLAGDYPDRMRGTEYLTAGPFDCSTLSDTRLVFRRWLGVEGYDEASVQVSSDGQTWKELWSNAGQEVVDRSWVEVRYEMGPHADRRPEVYLRWGMGPTDDSYRYCGWNIDDVAIWGVELGDQLGELSFDRPTYGAQAAPRLSLRDRGLDRDAVRAEQIALRVRSATEPAGEEVLLQETGLATGLFEARLTLSTEGAGRSGDGVLQVVHGDSLHVEYLDADDGTGQPGRVVAEALVDLRGPVVSRLGVVALGSGSATIGWTTDELASSLVRFGTAMPLDREVGLGEPVLEHRVTLTGLAPETSYLFTVSSTDLAGNTTEADLGGRPGLLTTMAAGQDGELQVLYHFDFEEESGWQAEEGWRLGRPGGAGGTDEGGVPDPDAAYSGEAVYGYDLAGDYPPGMAPAALTTPVLDLAGVSRGMLRFRRWLGVQGRPDADRARVELSVSRGPWTVLWQNAERVADQGWALVSYDLPAAAAGSPSVRLRWMMGPSDGQGQSCGWNIDEVELLGQPAVPPAGTVLLDRSYYVLPDEVRITVVDANLAASAGGPGRAFVQVSSPAEPEGEVVELAELRPGVFDGALPLAQDRAVQGDGVLQFASDGELVATYVDADPGQGDPVRQEARAQVVLTATLEELELSPIGAQVAGRPFLLVIAARDAHGRLLQLASPEAVALSASVGPVEPPMVGPLEEGLWEGYIVLPRAAPEVVLTAEAGGRRVESEPFVVWPGPAARLVFGPLGDQRVGRAFTVVVEAVDGSGNRTEETECDFTLDDGSGQTDGIIVQGPAQVHQGRWAGQVTLRYAAPVQVLTAHCGPLTGTSDPFRVASEPASGDKGGDDGCGCRTPAHALPPGGLAGLLLLLPLLVLLRGRRPRS